MNIGCRKFEVGSWKLDVGAWELKNSADFHHPASSFQHPASNCNALFFNQTRTLTMKKFLTFLNSAIRFFTKYNPESHTFQHLTSSIQLLILFNIFLMPLATAQTLESYLQFAAEHNPGLQAKYTAFEVALQRIPQVSALPDPTLSFGYFIQPVETRVGAQQARVELKQMFPWFGTLAAQKDAAAKSAQAQYQAFLDARNALFFQVTKAYYPLYEVNEMLRLQNDNLHILQSYKQLATTAFSNAKGTLVDVIRVDIMLEDAQTSIAILQDKKVPLRTTFNKLLNRPAATPIEITDYFTIDTTIKPVAEDSLLLNNPQLKAFDLKLQAAQAQEKVAFRKGLPSFGLGLSYVMINERPDVDIAANGKDALMPMVSMSIPLFRKKYNAAVKEARLQQTGITQQKTNMENVLITRFKSALFEMDRARQNYALFG
ncbi:MAG: TolC family protein, partial [Calditrichaeota bacterium]